MPATIISDAFTICLPRPLCLKCICRERIAKLEGQIQKITETRNRYSEEVQAHKKSLLDKDLQERENVVSSGTSDDRGRCVVLYYCMYARCCYFLCIS